MRNITVLEFSKLCQHLHDNKEFEAAILLIIESSAASLLFRPGGYAIALENLADLITANKKLKLFPINDKSLRNKILNGCKDLIDRECAGLLSVDTIGLLKSRVQSDLNKPTNLAQLKAPFDYLNIELTEKDIELLKTRNDFLHGRFPDIKKEGKNRSIDRINKDLWYASARFYTLLNMLVLKWVGFDSRVVNYPKISEKYSQIKLKGEEYFREI